jgi:hypothetical protein
MLARASTIRHPLGTEFKTPLLVPSFSSKGFRFNSSGKSEILTILNIAKEFLTESQLISAYDSRYRNIPPFTKLAGIAEITFVDSGGYETSDDHDQSAIFKYPQKLKQWTENLHIRQLRSWPEKRPAVFVTFDHGSMRRPLAKQIAAANRLAGSFPDQMLDFLIKPNGRSKEEVDVKQIVATVRALHEFHIVGLTEKELGGTTLKRMKNIAVIRKALDEGGLQTIPIHIFGSLDPLSSWLFFLAGAEIFDGLTWLRYSYHDGLCVYKQNFGQLEVGIDERDNMIESMSLSRNLIYMRTIQNDMREFVTTQDFSKAPHSHFIEKTFKTFESSL